MKINICTNFWLKHQVSSYINRNKELSNFIHFDMGECTFGSNLKLLKSLNSFKSKDFASYPEAGARKLKEAIAKHEQLLPAMVTVGCGVDELIETIPRLLLNPGDKTIVVTPTFFRFIEACQRQAAQVVEIPMAEKNSFNFGGQIAQSVIKKSHQVNAKLIWLCSPNNPTGKVIDPDLIAKIVKKSGSFVVVDEVFNGFLNPKLANVNLNLVKSSKNVMLLRSLSKAHGLASLRVGWGIAHPETVKLFEKWRLPFNIPKLSQQLAIAALSDKKNLAKTRKLVAKERLFINQQISLLCQLEFCSGSQTNIFMLRHKKKDLFQELLKRGILTADMRQANGLQRKGFVRITIQNRKNNLRLLSALKNI